VITISLFLQLKTLLVCSYEPLSIHGIWCVTERGGRGGSGGSGRRAADAATMTPSDDEFDGNETMSMVSNRSDLETAAQLTDGKCCSW